MARTRKTVPLPGQPVRGSRSGRPVMALLDLLGRRWALRILWELRDGPQNFRSLRARCDDMSPTVLNNRLSELRQAQIIDLHATEGFHLTKIGQALGEPLLELDERAKDWARMLRRQAPRHKSE